MKHRVLVLRVHRTVAGAFFPFDKVYFFRKEACELIPRVFPSCLVLDLNRPLVKMLRNVIDPIYGAYKPVVGKSFPIKRGDEETLKKEMEENPPISDVLLHRQKYLAVVPILFYTAKREGEPEPLSYPAYLVAGSPKPGVLRKVFERRTKQNIRSPAAKELAVRNMKDLVRNAVHNNAAFYYHGEKIEPVCGACTRSLFMLAGECRFGEARCYKALSSIAPSDFIKNMRDYQTYVREAAELEDSHVELRGN